MKHSLANLRLLLALVGAAALVVLLAQPLDGKAEATLVALALVAIICAAGLWALPRIVSGSLSIEEMAAGIPAVGVSLVLIPAFVAALADLPFIAATPLFLLPFVFLIWRAPGSLQMAGDRHEFVAATRSYWPLALITAGLVGALVLLATLSPRHLDGWATTAVMRAYRDDLAFDFSGSFRLDDNAWPAALAYLSWLLQVDTLVLYRTVLPPLVVVGSLLSAWGLAWAVFQRHGLALLTVAAQALILLTSITAFGFQPGWHVLFSAAEDKTLAAFVLLPAAMMFLLRALREEKPALPSYLPFAVVALAVGVVHPFVALMLALVTGALLLVRGVVSPRTILASALPLGVCLLALLPALLTYGDVADKTDNLLEPSGEVFVTNRDSAEFIGSINFLGDGWAVVHFRTIHQPLLLAGGALALLALLRIRDVGRQYIVAALLVVIAVAFNPLAIRALSYLTTTTITWRLTWLLPAALGIAAAIGYIIDHRPERQAPLILSAGGAVLVAVFGFAVLGPWTNEVRKNLDVSDATERLIWEPQGGEELGGALRRLEADGNVVLAPTFYNYVLPSFTSDPEVVFRGQGLVRPSSSIPRARERFDDIDAFYSNPSTEALLDMREKYSVDFLVTFGPVSDLCQGEALEMLELVEIYAVDDDGC